LFNSKIKVITNKNRDLVNSEVKLNFISIFNPHSIHNLRIIATSRSLANSKYYKLKKILVKQSYLLIYWLKFLSNKSSSLIFLPSKGGAHTTKAKAHMAHKTFSQEQFYFNVYRYTTKRLKLGLLDTSDITFDLSKALLLLLNTRKQNFFFGTNMLFISKIYFFKTCNLPNFLHL
jgi:hypothetical protein